MSYASGILCIVMVASTGPGSALGCDLPVAADPPRTAADAVRDFTKQFGPPSTIYVGATQLVFKKDDWDRLFGGLGEGGRATTYQMFGKIAVHTSVAITFGDGLAWISLDAFRPADGAVSRFGAFVTPDGKPMAPATAFRTWARMVNLMDEAAADPLFAFIPVPTSDPLSAAESIAVAFDFWNEIMDAGGAERALFGTGKVDLQAGVARCNCNNMTATYLAAAGLDVPELPRSMAMYATGLKRPMDRRLANKLYLLRSSRMR